MGGRGASSGVKGGGVRTRKIGELTLLQNQKIMQPLLTREHTEVLTERAGETFSHGGFDFGVARRPFDLLPPIYDVIELKTGANIGTTTKRSEIPKFVEDFHQKMKSENFQMAYKQSVMLNEELAKRGGKVSIDEYNRMRKEIGEKLKPKRKTK